MPSLRCRRRVALVALASAGGAVACNLITGEHDRFLRSDVDGSLVPDTGAPAPTSNPTGDGGPPDASSPPIDAAPDVFEIPTLAGALWRSPNGAQWQAEAAGTRITALGTAPGRDHAVLFPNVQPALPSDDYTVEATVHTVSPLTAPYPEFGVLARVLDSPQLNDDAGVVELVSSAFAGGDRTWIGTMGPPEWAPVKIGEDPNTHPSGGDRRFKFVVHARGANMTGRMWDASGPDPGIDTVSHAARRTTGRGVGFYTYGVVSAWLEDMRVTVP